MFAAIFSSLLSFPSIAFGFAFGGLSDFGRFAVVFIGCAVTLCILQTVIELLERSAVVRAVSFAVVAFVIVGITVGEAKAYRMPSVTETRQLIVLDEVHTGPEPVEIVAAR